MFENFETEQLLKDIMYLISKQFGDHCEVVLHSWDQGYDKTIVAIENGHVSGRKVGDCGTNLGLEVMRGTTEGANQLNYVTKTKDGKLLRSSSLYLKNKNKEAVGALCINFDITDLMAAKEALANLGMAENQTVEHFSTDVNELLDYLLEESERVVGIPVEDMAKEDKMKALKYLDEKGALLITKSGNRICKFLNISKFTLYNYLEEIREANGNKETAKG